MSDGQRLTEVKRISQSCKYIDNALIALDKEQYDVVEDYLEQIRSINSWLREYAQQFAEEADGMEDVIYKLDDRAYELELRLEREKKNSARLEKYAFWLMVGCALAISAMVSALVR